MPTTKLSYHFVVLIIYHTDLILLHNRHMGSSSFFEKKNFTYSIIHLTVATYFKFLPPPMPPIILIPEIALPYNDNFNE